MRIHLGEGRTVLAPPLEFFEAQGSTANINAGMLLKQQTKRIFGPDIQPSNNPDDDYAVLSDFLSWGVKAIWRGGQKHTANVFSVNSGVDLTSTDIETWGELRVGKSSCPVFVCPNTDGFVTREKEIVLAIYTADCIPIMIGDPVAGVVGAAHAGREGTFHGIARNLVKSAMELGATTASLKAWIAPGICGTSYEVSPEMADDWREQFAHWEGVAQGRYLDLPLANFHQLQEAGIPAGSIIQSSHEYCTFKNAADFFSYRRDGPKAGRHITAITMTPDHGSRD
jgi:YfiH family protein